MNIKCQALQPTLFLLASMIATMSCGRSISSYYKKIEEFGYIPLKQPLQYSGAGTLIAGNPSAISVITTPYSCFPEAVYGEQTELRHTQATDLPFMQKTVSINAKTDVSFLQGLSVGSPSIHVGAKFNEVKRMEFSFAGATIENMDFIKLNDFYKHNMSEVCKDYLEKVGFIIQALRVEKMTFSLFNESDQEIHLTLDNVSQYLSLSTDIEHHIINNEKLVIDSPKYIGYHLGALQRRGDGMVFFHSTKTKGGRFFFERIDSIDPDLDPDIKIDSIAPDGEFFLPLDKVPGLASKYSIK